MLEGNEPKVTTSIQTISKENTTLIAGIKQLLSQDKKIGVLVVDEENSGDHNPEDDRVDKRQEIMLKFAINRNLPIWFIEKNRVCLQSLIISI